MDTYTITALAIGGSALVIGLSRLIFRAIHIAKYGPPEVHNGVAVNLSARAAFRRPKRVP